VRWRVQQRSGETIFKMRHEQRHINTSTNFQHLHIYSNLSAVVYLCVCGLWHQCMNALDNCSSIAAEIKVFLLPPHLNQVCSRNSRQHNWYGCSVCVTQGERWLSRILTQLYRLKINLLQCTSVPKESVPGLITIHRSHPHLSALSSTEPNIKIWTLNPISQQHASKCFRCEW
jgi:hypothetical protein